MDAARAGEGGPQVRDRDRNGNRDGARLALLLLLPFLLAGCDVAVVAVLASRSDKSSSSSAAVSTPDTAYKVYVRDLGAAALDLDNEKLALDAAGGNPGAGWTFVAAGTATQDFDITALPGGPFHAVLVQAPLAQDYTIDAFELFDANAAVIETAAAASIRSDEVSVEADAASTPDGLGASTDSLPTAQAYLFARFTNPVTLFRLHLWGAARGSGDVEWVRTFVSPGNQVAGGTAVKADGTSYVTYSDESPRHVWLINYLGDGNAPGVPVGDPPAPVSLETNVTATVGSQTVAINGSNVYVATTFGGGDIRVSKIEGPGGTWSTPFSGAGVDRIEANGLALDGSGNLIVAGGFDFGGLNGVGHFMQKLSASGGVVWGGSPTPPADTNETYWHAVVAPGATDIYSAGNLFSVTPVPGSIQTYTRLSDSSATGAEVRSVLDDGPDVESDLGRAIGVDAAGSVYVAGFNGAAGPSSNAVLVKYAADLLSSIPVFESTAAGADEILDIAVEGDGTVYAVGYESVSAPAQGENLFLVKFAPNGAVTWKRTLHAGFGNDRGVSVSTTATHVYVAGQITVSGGTTDVHVRKYVR